KAAAIPLRRCCTACRRRRRRGSAILACRRSTRSRCRPLRSPGAALSALAETELRPDLLDHRIRRSMRFQRVAEVEPNPHLVAGRAFEIDRPKVDLDEIAGA